MFKRNSSQHKQKGNVEVIPYREPQEIVRVLLTGKSEVVIYRDEPGHLLFGLFYPVPRTPEN